MKKTSSVAPLVLAIIGMVFGFIGFSCVALCAELVDEVDNAVNAVAGKKIVDVSLAKLSGWVLLAGSVVALVGACCSRSQNWGPLVLLLGTVAVVVAFVLQLVAHFGFNIWTFIAVILFAVASLVALVKHAE